MSEHTVIIELVMEDKDGTVAVAILKAQDWIAFNLKDGSKMATFDPCQVAAVKVDYAGGCFAWPV